MGDRGIPKTWRNMNGYSSHTYMWVNAAGAKFWVKYHFKTDQGIEFLTQEDADHLAGADGDYHRRDLHLDAQQWRDYFKFGFVRNPFDRYVSTCFFLNRDDPAFARNARALMKDRLSRPRFQQRVLVRPQYLQLCNANGDLAVDFIGRYEGLQQSYDQICDRIGIPSTNLGSRNASSHAAYGDYYDDELRDKVARFYADDLRVFDYPRDL
jgi:hypothetical protein